ncbi:hypothetical protein BC833DRAFT_223998 [Globomyces pollinis-pini]|nr:hypothetical protein BC833DRAFT_223998 [Globomyces pollinis-pini]
MDSKRRPSLTGGLAVSQHTSNLYPPQIAAKLGGVNDITLGEFFSNPTLKEKYIIVEGIAEGSHWSAVKVKRKSDSKQLIIKKIIKAKLPVTEQYFQSCINKSGCTCSRCQPFLERPPLELILLKSQDTGLPELVEYIEDEQHYYLITKCHGVAVKRLKKIWTWFGSGKWSNVYWDEYFA